MKKNRVLNQSPSFCDAPETEAIALRNYCLSDAMRGNGHRQSRRGVQKSGTASSPYPLLSPLLLPLVLPQSSFSFLPRVPRPLNQLEKAL